MDGKLIKDLIEQCGFPVVVSLWYLLFIQKRLDKIIEILLGARAPKRKPRRGRTPLPASVEEDGL